MTLKKCNAVLALLTTALLTLHTVLNARMMLLGRVTESPKLPAFMLMGCVGVHALISLFVILFRNDGRKVKYGNISAGWIFQRITAVAMIPLVMTHWLARVGEHGEGLTLVLTAHILVMALAYIHVPLSVPNALVTLGILDSSKQHKAAGVICLVICVLLFLFGLTANLRG